MWDETRNVRENSFGRMLHRLVRHMDDRMTAGLEDMGLNLSEFPVMMTVLERAPLTQVEIGKIYQRPAYVISRALDGLEQQGLIDRKPHPTSRRAHLISPTKAGMTLAPCLHELVKTCNAETLAPLSVGERDMMLRCLSKIVT
ncbi:MarR family transcriptional regulator [uncultured Shimia sp.]|uniref:MarR family winged helix-turn-helix transcriptional regulator n=1 Tax=uncultured Shimia sp. TaxID=573152 RepID=UPI002634D011|nr:MarR family transcriptional regulator [uncultured Shimia sp.]